MAMTEDLDAFFSTAEFAVAATWTAAGGGTPTSGVVIYDANGMVLEEFETQTSAPSVACPASQWPTVAEGDALSIAFASGAVAFVVRAALPVQDGAVLMLTLART